MYLFLLRCLLSGFFHIFSLMIGGNFMLCHYCLDCLAYDQDLCQDPMECEHPWDCDSCPFDCPAFVDCGGIVESEEVDL